MNRSPSSAPPSLVTRQRLRTILLREREQGCQDRLVIGGLTRLVQTLAPGLAAEPGAPTTRLPELAADYAALAPALRAARLDAMLALLETAGSASSPPPSAPAPPSAPNQPATGQPPPPRPTPVVTARQRPTPALPPDAPVTDLRYVGTARAALLKRLNVETVADLLMHLPVRHDDFTRCPPIAGLVYGQLQTVRGRFTEVVNQALRGNRTRVVARLVDRTGSIRCTWFWPTTMAGRRALPIDMDVVVSGRVGQFNGHLAFDQPDYEPIDADLLHVGRLVPIYRLTDGLYQKQVRQLTRLALAATETTLVDPLPLAVRRAANLLKLHDALAQAHFPDSQAEAERARHRLAIDELLLIQLGMQMRRRAWRAEPAPALPCTGAAATLVSSFRQTLPFALTRAQDRALAAVLDDLAESQPMCRLIQGDVGSGKTVVAAAALLLVTAHGYQAALMAPTELLAEQHARTLERLYAGLPEDQRPAVLLLTGSLAARRKSEAQQAIADGRAQIVVGTQAVVQSRVQFANLALSIVDEQHRFGVAQRAELRAKGGQPHLLVMSATPIPRSLALTVHGDLDLTVIDQLPPGRTPVATRFLPPTRREEAYRVVREETAAGRQAFVVCPLVEESEAISARAATAEFERLRTVVFPDRRLGLLHGRMSASDKERVMREFRDRQHDILISTAVIEVGVDVPNATVILIEGADRFGLAQLHQFRGRVGRGDQPSTCLLLSDDPTDQAVTRLTLLAETSDGFRLAEHDLRLRGPGDFLGTRQSGLPPLRVAALGDSRTIEVAQRLARDLLLHDPELRRPEHGALARRVAEFWASGAGDVS